jgi:hypothetical protein
VIVQFVILEIDPPLRWHTNLEVLLTGDATLLTALDVPAPSVDNILELREPTPLVTGALRTRAELTSLGGSPNP